jgi:hypothetical protein
MGTDPNLTVSLDHDIAEIGATFRGLISRAPVDGETNDQTLGKVRAVRIALNYATSGRGDVDSKSHAMVEFPVDEYGLVSAEFSLAVPADGPISYDGGLIRVGWFIETRTDRQLASDDKLSIDVLVIPRNGSGYYDRPHPIHA